MSIHEFCDHCPGCRPAIVNLSTGMRLADDSPTMIAIMSMWRKETSYAERKAFIDVTVNNSRASTDLRLAQSVNAKIARILEKNP